MEKLNNELEITEVTKYGHESIRPYFNHTSAGKKCAF
jgi:hypothetical protein